MNPPPFLDVACRLALTRRLSLTPRAASSTFAVALVTLTLTTAPLLSCGSVILEESTGSGGASGNPTGGTSPTTTSSGGAISTGPHTCTATFADCNGDPTDGCEADLGTTSAHCGACDHDCLGSTCEDGMCTPEILASDLYYPNRLALDTDHVYWTSSDGEIRSLPLTGGTPNPFAAGQNDPWDIAVDGSGVYWTNSGSDTVVALPFGAGLPVLLAEAGNPLGITVHKGVVYYTDTYDKLSDKEHVTRVPLPGGPPEKVASTPGAWMVAADDQHIYWTDPATGAVWSGPALGGTATLLASVLEPTDIEVDSDAVYVSALEGTYRIPLSGGTPTVLVAGAGRGLTIDATHVFVGTADGRLLRVPKSGGPALALSKTDLYPSDIAVSADHVFWITRSPEGALLRTPK